MYKYIKQVLITALVLGVLVGCSAKPVGGGSGEESVFDDTIEVVEGDKSDETIDYGLLEVVLIDNVLYVKTDEADLEGYYAIAYSGDESLTIEGADLVERHPESIVSMDLPEGLSIAHEINGYFKGHYGLSRKETTSSDVIFFDGTSGAHLDLLTIEHGEDVEVSTLYLSEDFRSIYYELSNLEGDFLQGIVHHLDSNDQDFLTEGGGISMIDGSGLIKVFELDPSQGTLEVTKALDLSQTATEVVDPQVYDKVIANGVIMDPDTNTMKFAYDLGIVGDEIVAISSASLDGEEVIDASGLIVAPGFIDMLGFNLTRTVSKYKITDGVTTNLSLHGCTEDFDAFFNTYENKSPQYVNFGGAVFMIRLRGEVGLGYYNKPHQDQIDLMAQRAREEIESGAVAIAFSPEYYPGTSAEEIKAVMAVAAEYDIPTHFHLRYSSITGDDIGIKGVEEVIDYARDLEARVQIMHLHSTGGTAMMEEALALINQARSEGVQISYDIYPYDSWASRLSMQRFRDGWQERYGIDYGDLQIAGNGVWVTEDNFDYYKSQGALAIAYAMDEDEMLAALSQPYAQVGSDGNIESESEANNHFRGAGTFSRILGKYVRDEDVFSLMEGLRKMTINGAEHLESVSQDMAHRGRLQEGMIADITVFDYKTVLDQSTPEKPATESIGIAYVLVSGQVGLREGQLDTSVRAGVAIKSDFIEE